MLRQHSKINYRAHYLLTNFQDASLEDRFQYFQNPSAFVYPAIGILGLLNIGYNGVNALQMKHYTAAVIRITSSILAALLVLIDLCFIILHRRKGLTNIQFAKRQRYLRVAMVALMLAIDIVITFEFWQCASKKSTTCYMEFASKNVIATIIPIWLTINFIENVLKTVLFISVEIAMAQSFHGQPLEMRLTRPLYASCIALIFLAIQRWLEHEARQHFLAVVHREALQQEVTQKRHQIAATLESITEPEQLDLLLAGQDTIHRREQCAIMVARFSSFVEWRQQTVEPSIGVLTCDALFQAFDSLRTKLDVELLLMHGDSYVTSIGLRTALDVINPCPLIVLGTRLLLLQSKKLNFATHPLTMSLGFGSGSCSLAIARGQILSVVVDGAAMREAVKHVQISIPGVVMLPLPTWNLCQGFDFVMRDPVIVEDEEFTIIRRLGWKKLKSGETQPLGDATAVTLRRGGDDDATSSNRGTLRMDGTDATEVQESVLFKKSSNSAHEEENGFDQEHKGARFFSCTWGTEDCEAFVKERAAKNEPIVITCLLLAMFVDLSILLLDGALSVSSLIIICTCLLLTGLAMVIRRSTHIKLAVLGFLLFWLLCAASLVAGRSLANKNLDRFSITLALVVATTGEGLAGIPSLTLTLLGWITTTLLLTLTGGMGINQALWQVVVCVALCALVVNRNMKTYSLHHTILRSETLLLEAEEGRQKHEQVLNMLLPSYIVELVSRSQASLGTEAIADQLSDVAMMAIRLNPTRNREFLALLDTCHYIDGLFASLNDVSLIFMDGDTLEAAGPLQRPLHPLTAQPASSNFAGTGLAQMMEDAANEASVSLIKALSQLIGKGLRFSAVLHRSDAIAVVRRAKQPTFSFEGRGAEVNATILHAVVDGQRCATSSFVSMLPDRNAWASCGIVASPPEKWRFRAIGIQNIHLLRARDSSATVPHSSLPASKTS
jgi:hypothetical protein